MTADYRSLYLTIALAAVAASGCQGLGGGKSSAIADKLDVPDGVPWKADKEPEPGVPVRIVATWTDAVLQRTGQSAERGFGGRLYFYGSKDADPIAVEGQLVVYAFDEAGREPTDNKPSRRYVFPAQQFAKHRSESEFGLSYSVWLPWDEMTGKGADVSLIARFEPLKGGALLVSDQARARLPGPLDENKGGLQIVNPTPSSAVQQASHSEMMPQTSSQPSEPKRRMETTSIKLPKGFGG